jgi:hypothetical protein
MELKKGVITIQDAMIVSFNFLHSYVSFIPYFRLLVFCILVTLAALFFSPFFPFCRSCLAKYFITSSPKVTKNQKRKMRLMKHLKAQNKTKTNPRF